MPIEFNPWRLDPVTFEECLQYLSNKELRHVIVPRKLPELETLVNYIGHVQGSYLITGYRGVGKTSFVNYALAQTYQQLIKQEPPCVLVPVFLNLGRSYDIGKLLRRTIRQLYRSLTETQLQIGDTTQSLYSQLPQELQAELNIAYLKTSAKVSEATTEALKTVVAQATVQELTTGSEASGEYGILPDPLPAKVGAKLSGGYSRSRTSSKSEETARETVDSLEYLEYDDEIAEDELSRLISRLTRNSIQLQHYESQTVPRRFPWFWKLWGKIRHRDCFHRIVSQQEAISLQLVFVYDELDKMEPQEAQKMLSALKPILISGQATFIFIGGYEFAHQWLARTQPEGDSLYSLFTAVVYVPLCDDDEIESFTQSFVRTSSPEDGFLVVELLDHIKLHCGGTLRGIFQQVLPFIRWNADCSVLCDTNNFYAKIYGHVEAINAQVPQEYPPQLRDALKRLTYTWLMTAEREQRFTRQQLYDPANPQRNPLGHRWELAVGAHFEIFWKTILENGVFKATESASAGWYEFNSEFSLGHWIRFESANMSNPPADLEVALSPGYAPQPFPDPVIIPPPGPLPAGSRVPYMRNPDFVGREAALRAVAGALLQPSKSAVLIPQLVSGMGGIGKTQFAVEFAYRYGRFFKGVHWLNAGNPESIEAEIAACGLAQGVTPWPETLPEQVAATLRSWALDGPRLVIVDDLQDEAAATAWLPELASNAVHLLITSRKATLAGTINLTRLDIGVLSSDESLCLLHNMFGNVRTGDSEDELQHLIERLGNLPLPLELAGRHLLAHPKLSIPAYLARLQVTDFSPLQTIFDISWKQLLDDTARRILEIMAYCAPGKPIPVGMLRVASGVEDIGAFETAISYLINHAFIQMDPSQLPLIHALIAEYVRLKISPEQQKAFLGPLMDALEEASTGALQSGRPENFALLQPHLEAVLAHLEQKR